MYLMSLWHEIWSFSTGMDDSNSPFIPLKKALKDSKRIKYHTDYLMNLVDSIRYSFKTFLIRSGQFIKGVISAGRMVAMFSGILHGPFSTIGSGMLATPQGSGCTS